MFQCTLYMPYLLFQICRKLLTYVSFSFSVIPTNSTGMSSVKSVEDFVPDGGLDSKFLDDTNFKDSRGAKSSPAHRFESDRYDIGKSPLQLNIG